MPVVHHTDFYWNNSTVAVLYNNLSSSLENKTPPKTQINNKENDTHIVVHQCAEVRAEVGEGLNDCCQLIGMRLPASGASISVGGVHSDLHHRGFEHRPCAFKRESCRHLCHFGSFFQPQTGQFWREIGVSTDDLRMRLKGQPVSVASALIGAPCNYVSLEGIRGEMVV
jgi:hypothetical protein